MSDTKFVTLIRGCKNPKLAWIMAQLTLLGILYKIGGTTFNGGSSLLVEEGSITQALDVLFKPIGVMSTEGALTDENITPADLADDHPFFHTDDPTMFSRHDILKAIDEVAEAHTPPDMPADYQTLENEAASSLATAMGLPEVAGVEGTTGTTGPVAFVEDDDPFSFLNADPADMMPMAEATAILDDLLGPKSPVNDTETDPLADDPPLVEEVEVAIASGDDLDGMWDMDDEVVVEEHPELDYQAANHTLTHAIKQYPGKSGILEVDMFEVNSGNVSAIGAKVNQTEQDKVTLYAEFKGGAEPYRYGPVPIEHFHDLQGEAVRKQRGRQEASVGSMFHHLVKSQADDGKISCQRLTGGEWVRVLPKAERVKIVKAKKDAQA